MEYQNPVLAQDFPDPSSPVLGVDGWYYSFATNADKKNIQVLAHTNPVACTSTCSSALWDAEFCKALKRPIRAAKICTLPLLQLLRHSLLGQGQYD